MTDHDPFADDLEPYSGAKKPRKKSGADLMPSPDDAGEIDDMDLQLAFQPMNDLGNAKRLMHRFGDDLMFVENIGWFAWTGARWERERGNQEAVKRGHHISAAIRKEIKAVLEKDAKKYEEYSGKLYAWGVQTGNAARVNAMLSTAEPYLSQPVDVLDADPYLVASENCTIELASSVKDRPANRQDRITRQLGVRYVPGVSCPQFEKFLERVQPDPLMREYLRRALGYSLTASTEEQCIFIHYGNGNNGKSTFFNCMRKAFGTYSMNSPVATFLAKNNANGGGDASPDLARLPGARLVLAAEPPEGARLDEAKIKEMASGEPMTVRHLNQGFFEFRPVFKAHISTNHRPVIRGTDRGIWRRIRLIPWTVSIPKEEIDKGLEAKLMEEAEGILQWILTGTEEWRAIGLSEPEAALAAVEDYRADQDPVGEFLSAMCHIGGIDPHTKKPWETSAKDLYKQYKLWSEENALDPLAAQTFGRKLTGRGIDKRKTAGNFVYVGIAVMRDPIASSPPPAYGEPGYDGPME